jgi:hypothetical protein
MLVLGAGALPSTFSEEKSVCVSSSEAGPRSWVLGFGEASRDGIEVENVRCIEVGEGLC